MCGYWLSASLTVASMVCRATTGNLPSCGGVWIRMILDNDWSPAQIAGVLRKEGVTHLEADHIQPCARGRYRQVGGPHAS